MKYSAYTSVCSFVIFFLIFEIQAFRVPDQYFKRAVNFYRDSKYRNDVDNYQEMENDRMLDPIFNIRNYNSISRRAPPLPLERLDPKIHWNETWGSQLHLGQVSAVSIDPNGNVAIFHRGSRVWDGGSFNGKDEFDFNNNCGPVKEPTIILLDKNGEEIFHWGSGIFYMPHGLTIDHLGNYWITDVAMHQVFKFDAEDIMKIRSSSIKDTNHQHSNEGKLEKCADFKNSFNNSIIKPSLKLGVPFEPGNDNEKFCKPTSVAVMKNGDFFVADGYCNSRVIKFNSKGERILTWGRSNRIYEVNLSPDAFAVPHALALAEEFGYLYVADRENGRILCFHAANGSFHKEYSSDLIGGAIYSVAYAQEKLFLVNGPDSLDTPNRGFIIDLKSDKVVSEFAPNGPMGRPHDIAVTNDGLEIYVVELDTNRVTRFDRGRNNSSIQPIISDLKTSGTSVPDFKSALLTDIDINKTSGKSSSLAFSLIVSITVLIVICLLLAVIVSRWKKRGCLLTSRRRTIWESERKDNFKLTSLLDNRAGRKFKFFEKRPNTRDFSKLNTEPETSEDEHSEDKLVTFYVNDKVI
ncbi:peptidyl-alpha-hydroxyglycine alpha-amidating lyase 2-like [Leptopilina heterotoma]|uniref:peptidyl-alpha-hydroxyglycine alpha-amidating lyase 2-like n=1 Tax=Leptopilina heterotoma TaxID=63436 RepID=UPI001CA89FB9|nr:peptidyl-alpha-hydroxyglycine alpha-amidating lyase 2-like [Leptopilina heterotoma]